MTKKQHLGSVAGGALLIAGTMIGGGMLALPLFVAAGGMFPAFIIDILFFNKLLKI